MKRRNFLRNGLLASGAGVIGTNDIMAMDQPARFADPAFKMLFGIHDGMFKDLAGPDFVSQIKFAYDKGFRAIEDNGMMERTPEEQKKIGDTLQSLGMTMGVFVVTSDSWHW